MARTFAAPPPPACPRICTWLLTWSLQLMTKVDEDPPEVAVVFLDTMIEWANMSLIEKSQDVLLELTAALARNNLDEGNPLGHRLLNDPVEFTVKFVAAIVDLVQV